MPLNALDALAVTLLRSFEQGLEKNLKKGAVKLTLRVLFGPFLGPWSHLASIWEVQDLKKDDLGATRFRITFLHRNWTHPNVLRSVLVQVSARFSLFH